MSFTTAKLTELPFRNSLPLTSAPKPSLYFLKPFSSLRTKPPHNQNTKNPKKWDPHNPKSRSPSAPWLHKWPHPSLNQTNPINKSNGHNSINKTKLQTQTPPPPPPPSYFNKDKGQSAIERIVLRLRNLGLGSDDDEECEDEEENKANGGNSVAVTGDETLGDLLKREWVRPDMTLKEIENGIDDDVVLPWEREEEEEEERGGEDGARVVRRRTAKAPTLAELTIEDEELRRLRRSGMYIRERISIPKAGLTKEVLQKIHDKWRKEELVRLKFHEVLAHDMKTAHEIVEVGLFL